MVNAFAPKADPSGRKQVLYKAERETEMKKVLSIILSLLVIAGACVFTPEVSVEAAAAKLSKKSVKLEVGDSKKIKVKGTKTKAVWSSSDEKVATVKSGNITAKGEGTCKIIATVGSKKLTCKVTVNAKKTVSFDSTVKVGKFSIPVKSAWAAGANTMTEEKDGLSLVTYVDSGKGYIRSIVYEVVPLGEEADTEFTKEEFELIGEYFVQGFTMTTDAKDLKTDIVKDNGVFYANVTGKVASGEEKIPFALTYKIENGRLVATIVMEYSTKLSSEASDIAFEACKAAKKTK